MLCQPTGPSFPTSPGARGTGRRDGSTPGRRISSPWGSTSPPPQPAAPQPKAGPAPASPPPRGAAPGPAPAARRSRRGGSRRPPRPASGDPRPRASRNSGGTAAGPEGCGGPRPRPSRTPLLCPAPGAALLPRPLARGSGAASGAARPRTHIWYSSIASTSCPQESKSVPFLKLAPQRCRRLRAASDIAPALGHHAHPGPGHRAGQPLPPAPRPPPLPARPSPAAATAKRGEHLPPAPPSEVGCAGRARPRHRYRGGGTRPAARGGSEADASASVCVMAAVTWLRGSPPSQLGLGGGAREGAGTLVRSRPCRCGRGPR